MGYNRETWENKNKYGSQTSTKDFEGGHLSDKQCQRSGGRSMSPLYNPGYPAEALKVAKDHEETTRIQADLIRVLVGHMNSRQTSNKCK